MNKYLAILGCIFSFVYSCDRNDLSISGVYYVEELYSNKYQNTVPNYLNNFIIFDEQLSEVTFTRIATAEKANYSISKNNGRREIYIKSSDSVFAGIFIANFDNNKRMIFENSEYKILFVKQNLLY